MSNIRINSYIIDDASLMAEWNWEENEKRGLDPNKLTPGSGKKASWVCSAGHIWDSDIYHRARRGQNCPYCSGKKDLPSDLLSQHPDLMAEWDYEANTIDPNTESIKSKKVANWICPKGHKYIKAINLRASGKGCPSCTHSLRTSFPEQCFFFYTKQVYPDSINGYKDIFDNGMELDIYIPSIRTGIEYDGIYWHDQSTLPRERKKYRICKENNIRLFRIKEGPFKGFNNTADKIWFIPKDCDNQLLNFYIFQYLKDLTFSFTGLPDVNVDRDKSIILEYKNLKPEDSLLFLYPEVAKEWHPSKNGKLSPEQFTPGSSELVWWLCPTCGNEWQALIANRTKGHGCDKCAMPKRIQTRKDTILSKQGGIDKDWCLQDWDYESNEYGPDHYTNGSGEVVNWKCHKCGHRWKAAICDRTRDYKNGCPLCSGKTIVSGTNDLPTVMPELMQEWDYEHNIGIDPSTVGRGDHDYVFWKCKKCGYIWEAQIYNRANGKGCPCCANRIVVPGINDLATTDPDLAAEWHPTLNTVKPTEVTRGQSTKVYWLCSKCGNVWLDSLNHRSSGRGCSKCKKSGKNRIRG